MEAPFGNTVIVVKRIFVVDPKAPRTLTIEVLFCPNLCQMSRAQFHYLN